MVNKVMVLGRLGRAPEIKHTQTGQTVANFSVATSESWMGKDGVKQEKTEWHKVVVWAKLAELCGQYLGKGSLVFVEGKLTTRSWEGKNGETRYSTEILADQVRFLDRRKDSDDGEGEDGVGF